MTGTTPFEVKLSKLETVLLGVIGTSVFLHGVGRISGIIPAEPTPAWAFIMFGLAIVAVVVLP